MSCKCDNMAVMAIENSGRSKMDKAGHASDEMLVFLFGTVGCDVSVSAYSWCGKQCC